MKVTFVTAKNLDPESVVLSARRIMENADIKQED